MNEQCTLYHIGRQTCLEKAVLNADWLVLHSLLAPYWSTQIPLASDWSVQLDLIGQI